ncbi:MAG: crosslink repair DNA glycosylase YcaQ family protein, partial [Pseudomonadota bacterium]
MPHRVSVSAAEARRIALAASGFDRERPANANDARHFRRVMATLKLLQLDFVNVLVPAHYLILWSRLGAYDRDRFHRFVYGRKTYTEQWAHEASIVPVDAWPLLRERRAGWQPRPNNPIVRMRGHRRYLDEVLQQVQSHGALTAHELPPVPGPKRKPGEWYRSIPRLALEYHFARGELCVERRLPTFQRVYDLTERIVPAPHYTGVFDADDAARELLRRSAQALGVATASDLADYFRMSPRVAAPRIAELVEIGELLEVRVEGWPVPGYLHAAARSPRRIDACSLLSPFDPVVWYRPRAERLFDFHYRIEIYVPQAKRRYGYYVLPFLLGDRIV